MADDKELHFKVTGDAARAKSALQETARGADSAEEQLREMGNAGAEAGREAAEGVDELGESAGRSAGRVDELQNAIAGLVTLEGLRRLTTDAIEVARRSEAAIRGLEGVSEQAGIGIGRAFATAQALAADGLLTVGEASQALQNLLSRGYDIEQAEETLIRLKDAAAFNRAAHLSLGEAVVTATEGLKNENSVLVDNAGVTKNVSVIWQEYANTIGKSVKDLTTRQKILAEVAGIQRETAAQTGNATKALAGMEGQIAKTNQAISKLQTAFGAALFPALERLAESGEAVVENFLKPFAGGLEIIGQRVGFTVEALGDVWDAVFGDESLADLPEKLAEKARVLNEETLTTVRRYEQGLTPAMERAADAAEAMGDEGKKAGEDTGEAAKEAGDGVAGIGEAHEDAADAAESSAARQVQAMRGIGEATTGAKESTDDFLTSLEILQARAVALQAFRKGLISAEELGEMNRSLTEEDRARRRARARERAAADSPARADWTGEASRGREEMEREFASTPLRVPVEFTSAGGDYEDAALMIGD